MTVRMKRYALLLGLLGLAALPGSAAEPLGRLFMTPAERQELDALRTPGGDVWSDARQLAAPAPVPASSQVLVNGVVRRSRGPDVVCVNGRQASSGTGGIRLKQGPDATNRVTLEAPADGSSVRLKPGQYWEPATGRVANCYGCGTAARPADAAPATAAEMAPAEATADKP